MIKFAIQLVDPSNFPKTGAGSDTLQKGFSIFYEIIGALAIFLIVVAALRYMLAGGDASKVAESKKMIAYTLVGLVVISLAAVIVEFVLKIK